MESQNPLNRADSYLGSNAIRAMSSSLSLAATVLRFQIIELWHENQQGEYCCTYVHATDEVTKQYKDIIVGYYPEHTREHMISPRLCELSKQSTTHCHWRSVELKDGCDCLYKIAGLPVQTEMSYVVEGRSDGPNVFIVGFASELLEKKPSKMKFLFGLGYAISVAAFEFEEDEDEEDGDVAGNELDMKKFIPTHPLVATPMVSSISLAALAALQTPGSVSMGTMATVVDASLGIWGRNLSEANFQSHQVMSTTTPRETSGTAAMVHEHDHNVGLDICDSPADIATPDSSHLKGGQSSIHSYSSSHHRLEPIQEAPSSHLSSFHSVDAASASATAPATSPSPSSSSSSKAPKLAVPILNLTSIPRSPATVTPSAQAAMEVASPSPRAPDHHNHHHLTVTASPFVVETDMSTDNNSNNVRGLDAAAAAAAAAAAVTLGVLTEAALAPASLSARSDPDHGGDSRHSVSSTILTSLPPTWDPVASFSFPVATLPAKQILPDDLTIDSFSDVKHIADGSNANIFTAKFHGKRVIIKMIKASVQADPVSVHEFDVEHGLLCRISHPNIIKILGAGVSPRRFIVLEYLGGGTLNTILSENVSKSGLASRLFRKPSFTYNNLLMKARDMADALDYIHRRIFPGACIIHRDIKPDNVGFSTDGVVKLFDFGLATCVKARATESDSYEMTGMTGSLRYMAPETALRKPYNEKVDVYSYGILIWQMARDRVPFKGFSKDEFLKNISLGGERPKLDSSWPAGFSNLLTRCWHEDALQRPSFQSIVEELDRMIHGSDSTTVPVKKGPMRGASIKGTDTASTSTWF